jgi:hypothetical protein
VFLQEFEQASIREGDDLLPAITHAAADTGSAEDCKESNDAADSKPTLKGIKSTHTPGAARRVLPVA